MRRSQVQEYQSLPFLSTNGYLNQRAKATFDEIAEITEGTSKSLDSTDADSLIHAICETALEDIGGVDMKEKYRVQYRG